MLNEEGYNVIIRDLPYGVHGFTRLNEDTSYSIILNARDTYERRMESYDHEVSHIVNGDYCKTGVQTIEFDAHYGDG